MRSSVEKFMASDERTRYEILHFEYIRSHDGLLLRMVMFAARRIKFT